VDLVEALPAVRRRFPGARVVLIGSDDPNDLGYARRVRSRIAQLGLDDVIALVGHRDDAPELIAGADVVAIPSTLSESGFGREGFGLVAVEAMAAGVPVVAYADGALPETLGGCGALVAPGDSAALAEEISSLLGDPEARERMVRCGYRRARERYSLAAMSEGMRSVYREAAGPEAPRPARG